ncbi:MAG: efflux RND transporter periplasmic adaptor subunit [Fibrobacteres bacterium]|nr:efflux RND transporter periplasmic adaptor subunit [Fibrobacterota bacterium]
MKPSNAPNPEEMPQEQKPSTLGQPAPRPRPAKPLMSLEELVNPVRPPSPEPLSAEVLRKGLPPLSAILIALAITGCSEDAPHAQARPPVVRVATVAASDSAQDLVLSGHLEAETSVAVSFGVPGSVERVLVDEGQAVSKGQVLAILDAGSLKDQLAMSQAKADQAEDAWRRMEPMHKGGTLAEIRWVEIETGRNQARSAVSMSKRNLEDAVLRAPISGLVARRNLEPGERALPGASAFTVVQTSTMLSTVQVAEKDIARVRKGMAAHVEVSATGSRIQGVVREIGVEADPFTRTYKVKVALPNRSGVLKVGMVSQVRLSVAGAAPTPIVPPAAVLTDAQGRRFVWTVTDSVLHRREVRTGSLVQEGIAVDSGLAVGETVVVSGTPMLSEGLRVQAGK